MADSTVAAADAAAVQSSQTTNDQAGVEQGNTGEGPDHSLCSLRELNKVRLMLCGACKAIPHVPGQC